MSNTINRVLITGAAGKLGSALREHLKGEYPILRVSDKLPLVSNDPREEVDTTDLSHFSAVKKMMSGVDAVVHLGGFAAEGDWQSIVDANITGMFNVLEAARVCGTKRIVYASSNHAVGFHPREARLDHTAYPLPDSRYGVSKAVGESLAAMYAYKHGVQTLCMRIGNFASRPTQQRHLSIFISPRDFFQLVRVGLEHPDILFEVVYGVSANSRNWWDNSNATRLGYRPQDNAEDYAADVPDDPAPSTPAEAMVQRYQGGIYCAKQ